MKDRCILARYERIEKDSVSELTVLKYTCDEVRQLKETWKAEFRERNGTDKIKKDRRYEEYCNELDEFLNKCTCKPRDQFNVW